MLAPISIIKIMAEVRMVAFRASRIPAHLRRPADTPINAAKKAPRAAISDGVQKPPYKKTITMAIRTRLAQTGRRLNQRLGHNTAGVLGASFGLMTAQI